MNQLKEFGIYKAVTSNDPIDFGIGLAMMNMGEEQEQQEKEEEEYYYEIMQEIIEEENKDEKEITADDILKKIERNQKELQKSRNKI